MTEKITEGASHYRLFVDGQVIHQCDDWYVAHMLHTDINGIDEWHGLPIYTEINDVPTWGNTPEQMENHDHMLTLRSIRTRYLKTVPDLSEEEREQRAREQLSVLVTQAEEKLAAIHR